MNAKRIQELRAELDAERISYDELHEIEVAFDGVPDAQLRDLRENAFASDMLDEIEAYKGGDAVRYPLDPPGYAARVRELEAEGLTTSDAQGVADAEYMQR